MRTFAETTVELPDPVVLGVVKPGSVTKGAADSAALLRIALGLVYLWAFIEQAFGVGYTNTAKSATGQISYGWHFSYNRQLGWITSGFSHSPTAAYIGNTHGPLAFIPQGLP